MTAVPARDELHHLVDRLTPGQVRRLLTLVNSDPELAEAASPEEGPAGHHRTLAIAGILESGCSDLSERVDEILHERFSRPA
jgi:hypothetical protein